MTTPMDLKVRVLGDVSQFSASMQAAAGSAAGFKSSLAAAVSAGAVVAYVDKITASAERIADISAAVGVTSDTLQAVDWAARHAGASLDDFRVVLATLSQKQGQLIAGSKEAEEQFAALGLSAESVAGMTLDGLFDSVAQALANSTNRASAMAAAVELIGRQAKTAMGALQEIGSVGLGQFTEQAREAGQIIDASQLREIAKARDNIEDVTKAMNNFVTRGIGDSIELIRSLGAGFDSLIETGSFWKGYDQVSTQVLGQDEIKSQEQMLAEKKAAEAKTAEDKRLGSVAKENTAMEAVLNELKKQMEQYTMTEETILGLRKRELSVIQERGATEAAAFVAEGKLQDARNAGLRANIEGAKVQAQIYALQESISAKGAEKAQEEADFRRSLDNVRVGAPEAADALARMGGYVGGQADPNRTILQRQVLIQQKIEEHTRRMAEKEEGGVVP